jgi:hypothetical protein
MISTEIDTALKRVRTSKSRRNHDGNRAHGRELHNRRGVRYDVVSHAHSHRQRGDGELAHVPGDRLAKSVVLEDDEAS